MSASPQPAKRKRVRSESQMDKKRLADRNKHKENRLEGKNRMERIEKEVLEIKAGLQSIMQQLQSLQVQPPAPGLVVMRAGPAAGHGPVHGPSSILGTSSLAHASTTTTTTAHHGGIPPTAAVEQMISSWPSSSSSNSLPSTWPWAGATTPNPATRLWTHVPESNIAKMINCRCGSQHLDRFDTIEQCSVTTLYQHHIAFPPVQGQEPSISQQHGHGQGLLSSFPLPRNPSLPAMMLHNSEENLATYFITGYLREYRNKSVEQLLAYYLLAYRYMRWRISPSDETMRDVPSWLMPTALQMAHPHPVVVDYLPWPGLRDYLCLSGNGDPRHCINYYFESTEFDWPAGSPLFGQGKEGQVVLNPEFEVAVMTLANWRLGSPWAEAFPDLLHLISTQA